MAFFPNILYFAALAICVYAMVSASVSRKKDGLDGMCLITVLLAASCGALVSVVYIVTGRALSGVYAGHLAFAVSPIFLRRMSGNGRLGLVCPLVVSAVVIVGTVMTLCGIMPLDIDRWLPLLMSAVLLVLMGRIVWMLCDGRARFDAVGVCREWMVSFVDVLYYASLVLIAVVGFGIEAVPVAVGLVLTVLLIGLLIAMWLRLRSGRAFLILTSKEDAFLGNVSRGSKNALLGNVECGLTGEELFLNLKEYFEEKMPYLNPELSASDVSKYLVTNRVYLSRAINDFTGQNFCQFVNFYRVKYAVRLFTCNSSYKIADLAAKSGFNSLRAFTMAFRLYMNMSPSRWCKQNLQKHNGKILRN